MRISENKKVRRVVGLWVTLQLMLSMTMVAYASNYAENAAKWGLDQLFWIVLAVTAFALVGAIVRKSTSTMIISLVVGGVVAYFCKNPEKISSIGETIGGAIFK